MNRRKLIKTIGMAALIGTIAIGMAGCGKSPQSSVSSGAPGAAKIGFIAALSGGAAAYGLGQQEGTMLAVEEINAKGDLKIDLETMDTKGSTQQAISAAQKLINSRSSIVIGPTLSGEMKAAGPILQKAGMPTLGTAVTAEGITDIGDCIFRNASPESANIPQTVKKTHKLLGYQSCVILYSNNNEHQVSAYKVFARTLKEEGVDILATETFADGDHDFAAQVTKIHDLKPDCVIIAGYYQEGALILRKMREMGMDQPVLGDNGFVSPRLMEQAGAAADNVYASAMWSANKNNERTKTFVENFTKKYGHAPDQFSAGAYDGVYIALEAMKKAGTVTDHKKIRDAMAKIKDFHGVCGDLTFDAKRDPVVDLVLLKVENGAFREVEVK